MLESNKNRFRETIIIIRNIGLFLELRTNKYISPRKKHNKNFWLFCGIIQHKENEFRKQNNEHLLLFLEMNKQTNYHLSNN